MMISMNSESEFTHAQRLQQFYNALVLKAPLDEWSAWASKTKIL